MIGNNNKNYRRIDVRLIISSVLLTAMLFFMTAATGFAYAAIEETQEKPIREVHNVGVGNGVYCYFVTHNVVLTPAQVAEMTDDELTAYILGKAGLYYKKANCRSLKNDKMFTVKDWEKKNGAFFLSKPDLEGIRAAEPADGDPVKFYMDLLICEDVREHKDGKSEEPASDEEGDESGGSEESADAEDTDETEDLILYSTFKRNEPKLIFAVVATEKDAAFGEDICKEDQPKQNSPIVLPQVNEAPAAEDEMLPEYRTINMVDRSGKPVESTLKDGEPVTLEWKEPKNNSGNEDASFIDRVPGGIAGLAALGTVAAAAVIAAVVIARNKKKTDW